jgi:hypothetical protein
VDQPEGPAHRDLPVGDALQVARELRLREVGVDLQRGLRRNLLGDDLRGFTRAVERARDDARQPGWPEALTDGDGLRAPEGAEMEAGEVAVQDPVRVLDVRVPDEEDSGQRR